MKLQEIRERVEKATSGPWMLWNGWGPLEVDGLHRASRIGPNRIREGLRAGEGDIDGTKDDLEFVAHARQDIPDLLDALEEAFFMLRQIGVSHVMPGKRLHDFLAKHGEGK